MTLVKDKMLQNTPDMRDSYRPDIDGLRAVAVILVLMYHVGFEEISAGFIGVDIFFVISGYLITKILMKGCSTSSFDYLGFLSKRFFRLYPALLVTLALTWTAGFLLVSPEHFKALGKFTASAQFWVSNIVFLREAGYFAEVAGTNPLLHTWTLAVEQQFYLFWPVLIFLAFKVHRSAVPVVIVLTAIASLAWSQHIVGAAPDDAYFLVQSRIFEFAVGGIIPWIELRKAKYASVMDGLLLIGLGIIFYCALTYTKATPFPGLMALFPCLGAALCIYAGQARKAGLLLSNPAMVWIGKISYSVYLAHWPIFVLYRYYRYDATSIKEQVAIFFLTFVVAYPMFKMVEVPFRRLNFGSMGLVRGVALATVSVLVIGAAWYSYEEEGAPWRLDSQNMGRLADSVTYHTSNYGGAQFQGEAILGDESQTKVSALVFGDSFAGHLTGGLNLLLAEHHLKAISIWASGCLMTPRYVTGRNGTIDAKCLKVSTRAEELARAMNVPIIYAQSWSGGYYSLSMDKHGEQKVFADLTAYYNFMSENIRDMSSTFGPDRRIIVVGSPPGDGSSKGVDLKTCLNRPTFFPSDCQDRLVFRQEVGTGFSENVALGEALADIPNVSFINPYEVFCELGECRALLDDKLVYSDNAHLSLEGSRVLSVHFADRILPLLKNMVN